MNVLRWEDSVSGCVFSLETDTQTVTVQKEVAINGVPEVLLLDVLSALGVTDYPGLATMIDAYVNRVFQQDL